MPVPAPSDDGLRPDLPLLLISPLLAVALGLAPTLASAQEAEAPTLVPPRLLESPALSLPEDAPALPPDAAIVLLLTIDQDGVVTDVAIDEALREDVDGLALELATQLRFAPATRDGEPIPARIRFRFRVQNPKTETETETEAETEAETDPGFAARATVDRPDPGAATRITLEGEELTTVPGTFGEPLRVVQSLPGVARTPFGGGFYVVRGAAFQNTGFLVDGFEVPLLYHLGAGPAVISSRFVDKLDFYPGGFPVRYGRFTAGLISLETDAPAERLHIEGEIDIFKASALAVIPFDEGRGTIAAAYRRSYYELLLPAIAPGTSLFYQDWQVRIDYEFSPQLSASLFYFGSEDNLGIETEVGAAVDDATSSTDLEYRFQRLIGTVDWKLGDGVRLVWRGTVGINDAEIRQRDPGGLDTGLDLEGSFFGQRLQLVIPEGDGTGTSLGVDVSATVYDAVATFPVPPGYGAFPTPRATDTRTGPPLSIEPVVLTIAPYIEQVANFDPLEVVAGLRLEYLEYARVSRPEFEPRLVARLKVIEPLTLKVATGLFSQPPLPYHIARDFGNPDLLPQRSWQNSGGLEAKLPGQIEIESQLFYNRFYRMPRVVNDLVTDEVTGETRRQVYADDGEGQAYGLELLVRRRLGTGFFGWISYTLAWSERFTVDGGTQPVSYDQRHTLYLTGSYAWNGWRFGARFAMSTGRPRRPIVGADYDVECDCYRSTRGSRNDRLPTFHQLDIRIDRQFSIGDHLVGSVYLDILNVYNAQNSEGTQYQYDFGDSARVPGLPFLPTLGVRLEYE